MSELRSNLPATGGVEGPGRIGRVSIGDILQRSARRFPDRIALTDAGRIATYAEIDGDANRLANHLLSRGLSPGDKISTICNNSIDLVKTIFAIHRAGLVFMPINTLLGSADMRFILTHAEVRFAVIDDNLYAQPDRRAVLDRARRPARRNRSCRRGGGDGLADLRFRLCRPTDVEPDVDIDDRDLAMIIYTSGTTSRPKGAMHCHLAVVMAAMSNAVEWSLQRDDGITGQLPLFHCAGHVLCSSVSCASAARWR